MVSRVQKELPSLFALARDRSEAARMQLAAKLGDLFLGTDVSLSQREEVLLNELMEDLLKINTPNVRHALAEKFANAAKMPRSMALSFASGGIDVARAVLLTNETLTDGDLVSVIETQSRDHACAIAARKAVSEAVADALVTTGDIRVMQVVAENMGAKLSMNAITVLSEAARLTASLQQPVLDRPELSRDIATKLFWWLSEDLRRAALERFGFATAQIDLALATAIEAKLTTHLLERDDESAMTDVADWLAERGSMKLEILPELLRLRHFRLFNIALARMAKVDIALVDMIVAEPGGRLFAALCKAIGVPKGNFVSLFLLSRGARPDEQIVHPREMSNALAAFDRLEPEMAQNMILTWSQNPRYLEERFSGEMVAEA